jgi:hypothetical protein
MTQLILSRWPGRWAARRRQPNLERRSRRRLTLELLEGRCLPSTVTNLDDAGDGSLRQALLDTPAGGVVEFQAGLTGTINLTSGELVINNDVTIAGPGADLLNVSGNHRGRVFDIPAPVHVDISGLTISNGQVAAGVNGGGIYNVGRLTVADCTLSGNTTPAVVDGGSGGGIFNAGTLTAVDSTFSGNVAGGGGSGSGGGGGIANQGTLTVVGSAFSNNFGIAGGGIDNRANRATVIDSIFRGNTSRGEGSGGAGIANFGTMTVTGSTFSGNMAMSSVGGGIDNFPAADMLTVVDSTFSNNSAALGGGIDNGSTLTITESTLSDNSAANGGGAIANTVGVLTITNCSIMANSTGGPGGGIATNISTVTVNNTTISGNHASTSGGGIDNAGYSGRGVLTITASTLSNNSADIAGGAIHNSTLLNGIPVLLAITNSTLSNNSAPSGGAIDNIAAALTITNSTLSNNSAASGGAINNHDNGIFNNGTVTLTSCTLSGNSATQTGGALEEASSQGSTTVRNSIVAANTAPSSPDADGSLNSQGYNLIGDGTGSSGWIDTDSVGTADAPIDPVLGPLQDNGGPTWTMAVLPGSPALAAGDSALLGTADQRGVPRSGSVNMGAYQASAIGIIVTAPSQVTAGMPFDLTVTVIDRFRQLAIAYSGTVAFFATDHASGVSVPAVYTFTAADAGIHTFTDTGLGQTTLITPGLQTIFVQDTAVPSILGSAHVVVQAALRPDGGRPRDSYDREVAAAAFRQIHEPQVVRTDPGVEPAAIAAAPALVATLMLPADYRFQPSDQGSAIFTVTLNTPGPMHLTVTDMADDTVFAALDLIVL